MTTQPTTLGDPIVVYNTTRRCAADLHDVLLLWDGRRAAAWGDGDEGVDCAGTAVREGTEIRLICDQHGDDEDPCPALVTYDLTDDEWRGYVPETHGYLLDRAPLTVRVATRDGETLPIPTFNITEAAATFIVARSIGGTAEVGAAKVWEALTGMAAGDAAEFAESLVRRVGERRPDLIAHPTPF